MHKTIENGRIDKYDNQFAPFSGCQVMDEHTCTTREAAKALGICVRTAQLWVETGRLRAWKTPGGHRRISWESVSALLHAHEEECGSNLDKFDVLIVEDDRIQRVILQAKIQEIGTGINVRSAYNGMEGLIKLGEHQPQVLIADLLMPGMDGFQLLGTLTSSPLVQPIHLLVTTGLTEAEIKERGVLPERVVVFHKPIQFPILVAMIHAFYDGWEQNRRAPK